MENKKIIFYTPLLYKTEKNKNGKNILLTSFKKTKEEIKLVKNRKIEIWGATATKDKLEKVYEVKDHINFSGNNPLIGQQQNIKTNFPDISNLYENTKNGIITTTRGKYFLKDKNYKYPTQYFCYFAIMARAIGVKKIKGYLINKDINILKKHILAKT